MFGLRLRRRADPQPVFFTCPRRAADGRADSQSPLSYDGPGRDTWSDTRECSYDGSLHPDDFMEYVRAGGRVGPSDKSYKFYLETYDKPHRGAAKFYTHHLSPEQSAEFFFLWTSRRVAWGYPGDAYVNLYLPGVQSQFCRCAHVNDGEPIDWHTEKCSACGRQPAPPGGGV